MELLDWQAGATTVAVTMVSFELWKAWNATAPSLAVIRKAEPGDVTVRQQLLDAEMTVGTMTVGIGTVLSLLTKSVLPLLLMVSIFATLAYWSHAVLTAESR